MSDDFPRPTHDPIPQVDTEMPPIVRLVLKNGVLTLIVIWAFVILGYLSAMPLFAVMHGEALAYVWTGGVIDGEALNAYRTTRTAVLAISAIAGLAVSQVSFVLNHRREAASDSVQPG
jgi:hypothetical protein